LLTTRGPTGHPDAGAMAFTSPAVVVEGGLHRIRGLVQSANRHIAVDLPESLPCIRIDASAMECVLANLLENGIKYSPPGAPIYISAEMSSDADLTLSVEDRGPGVPLEGRERIFEPFVRKHTFETCRSRAADLDWPSVDLMSSFRRTWRTPISLRLAIALIPTIPRLQKSRDWLTRSSTVWVLG
jgi:hypothetical protein